MFSNFLCAKRSLAAALCTLASPSVFAHTPQTPQPPDRIALGFDSVFARYKPLGSLDIGSWRDANDTVNRIGGWRNYLKDTQQTLEAEKAKSSGTAAPVSPGAPGAPASPAAPTRTPSTQSGRHPGAHQHGSPR